MKIIEDILLEVSLPHGIKNSGFTRMLTEIFSIPTKYKPNKKLTKDVHNLLFVIIFPSHIKKALPIIKKLKSNKINFSILLFDYEFKDELVEFEDRLIFFNNLFSYGDYFLSCLYQINNFFKFRLRNDLLFSYKILKFYKISFLLIKGLESFLIKNKIKKIIFFKGDGVQVKTISKYLKQSNPEIKLIVIQHGIIAQNNIHSNLSVDEFWVWSTFWKKRLLRSNIGCSVEVVGDPEKDQLFKNKQFLNKPNLNKFKILFAPNSGNSFTSVNQVLHSCKIINDFANENDGIDVIVKPHPGDFNGIVKNFFLANCAKVSILNNNIDMVKNNFCEADLLVINNSGILTESAIIEIPGIIIAENNDQLWVKQYLDFGIAELALNYNQFVEKINAIKSNYKLYRKNCVKMTNIMYQNQGITNDLIFQKLTN